MNAVLTEQLPTLATMELSDYRTYHNSRRLFDSDHIAVHMLEAVDAKPAALARASYPRTAMALSIWNEAHNENDRRTLETPHTVDNAVEADLRAQLEAMTTLATERGQQLDRLRHEQISGDDPRLTEFWNKANELASNAGHCGVYDELAEELGGPGRVKTFDFTMDVTVTVVVSGTGRDVDDAWDSVDRDRIFEAFQSTDVDAYGISHGSYDDYEEVDD